MCEKCPITTVPRFPPNFTVTPGRTYFPNPGTITNLHRKTREIMPDFFDGIQLSYKKGLAPNKVLLTSWILSHTIPSGFRIGGAYHWKCRGNIMESPIIEADINPSTLSSNLSILYYPIPQIRIESRFQSSSNRLTKYVTDNRITLEYTGSDSTLTFCSYNSSRESGRFTFSYLRSISDNFAIGSELLVEWLGGDMLAKTALAARYSMDKYSIAATVSREALDVSYWRQVHRAIQMGTTLAFNKNTQKAIGSICYQWDFKDATVRGMVDSDWSVGVMYQRSISNLPLFLGISVLFCIPSSRFTFGLKFDLDPSGRCAANI